MEMAENTHGYGCVIDAGSSGSRVYLYRWLNKPQSLISKYFSHETLPGISDPINGIPALLDLISLAKSSLVLAGVDVATVPIHLGATAGMRILSPEVEVSIMKEIRSLLQTFGFLFRKEWAKTISGEEEGAFGWLVANYLKNNGKLPSRHTETSYGAIDLGGASAQISFRPTGAILAHQFPVQVEKTEYSLYTHSFLYYGVDQAHIHFHSLHLDNYTSASPCYPVGYTDHTTGISGTSRWDDCLVSVASLFDKTYDCYHGDGKINRCSFNGIYQPPLENKTFIAMSAFVYTWDFLGLRTSSETDDLKSLIKRAQHVCKMPYEEQLKWYDDLLREVVVDRRTNNVHQQCFNAAYAYHLLTTGFGLPVNNTPIEIHGDIDGTQVQWALGMMLVERNKGSCELSGRRGVLQKLNFTSDAINIDYKVVCLSLLPALMLVICILGYLLHSTRQKYRLVESYLPISAVSDKDTKTERQMS
jgi:Golgi nucleoside diphosphatase